MNNPNPHSSIETINKTKFGKCKLSEMLPALKMAAKIYGLNINRPHQMRVAIRVCANSVINN